LALPRTALGLRSAASGSAGQTLFIPCGQFRTLFVMAVQSAALRRSDRALTRRVVRVAGAAVAVV